MTPSAAQTAVAAQPAADAASALPAAARAEGPAPGRTTACTAAGCLDQAITFACQGETLLGVLSQPALPDGSAAPAAGDVGVLVVVGGPQYRAGSHRQFVQLARALAAAGVPVLRFDVRGMGDSSGAQRSFEQLDDDIAAAIAGFQQAQPQLRRVVLWGLCDGASAALLYLQARRDARVAGLVLLNPWVRSAATLAQTQVKHYYRQRLMQRDFWAKLLRGGVAGQALRDLLANLRTAAGGDSTAAPREAGPAPFQRRMAQAWQAFEGPVLLVLSERDTTAQEFEQACRSDPAWRQALARRSPQQARIPGADHTCSQPAAQRAVEQHTLQWLQARFGLPGLPAGRS